ncbi:hypothetical protein B0G76_7594 [Paraburkholderia sp. BL23I1N1]|nr:hypothetical protein B0G76_7594 [Paraburkholderia sp. BL23I1N1]
MMAAAVTATVLTAIRAVGVVQAVVLAAAVQVVQAPMRTAADVRATLRQGVEAVRRVAIR